MLRTASFLALVLLASPSLATAANAIRLAAQPGLSPDGETLAFAYAGDVWLVSSRGGAAQRLTTHSANDSDPHFSPNGKQIAFVSSRTGSNQIFVVPSEGGTPRQITHHTEGYAIEDWYPDGRSLLVSGFRDHHWRHPRRFFRVSTEERSAEQIVFDAYGSDASVSPDGQSILFVREGERWWRKGYRGPRSAQIWRYDIADAKFTKIRTESTGCRWPLWSGDGTGMTYVGGSDGSFNLWRYTFETQEATKLTSLTDDSVVFPTRARRADVIVFRHLFDLYRWRPELGPIPEKIEIVNDGVPVRDTVWRRTLSSATNVSFSDDGLEMAIAAGGDIWVMDTELREPRQVTKTPEEEREPVFAPDGQSILFISDVDGQTDLWKAARTDKNAFWFENSSFDLARLTQDAAVESDLEFTPTGGIAYVRGRGELWIADADGKNGKLLVSGFLSPSYDFSPDGRWIVYAQTDDDFNEDVWLKPVDGSKEPFNLSRHPDSDLGPAWSPDGKVIAYTSRRGDNEVDIHYVWLTDQDDDRSNRDRKLEKAREKLAKARKKGAKPTSTSPPKAAPAAGAAAKAGPAPPPMPESGATAGAAAKAAPAKPAARPVKIDFEDIHRRIRRISIPNSSEGGLLWSPDSKKLAFRATVAGKSGTYTVEFPNSLTPKLLTTTTGGLAKWSKTARSILWLANGVPAALSESGKSTAYSFRVYQEVELGPRYRAAFDQCWRVMRDWWYDERMGNRNWDAIRRKYGDMAADVPDVGGLTDVVNLMLGELNGSHLGFRGQGSAFGATQTTGGDQWRPQTPHLGVRFDPSYQGPGLRIRDVLPRGPATQADSRLEAGEIVLAIDGKPVDPALDLTTVLNGRMDRDIQLQVRAAEGKEGQPPAERRVVLRPTSYGAARSMLYAQWQEHNRQLVGKLSENKLGYLHIRSMNMPSFVQFEKELYDVGYGKDGLVIDVRDNGGGFTTDHLLTALTQPRHAITVPRGGGQGYPQSRMVYATWNKPIIVLCNQNSFSNAEIFSHAIKGLKRGRLVGVTTAGGVISTGSARIMDVGILRRPFRGWYVVGTGEDMELNGAVPDLELWPEPGDVPSGKDTQIEAAVKMLLEDVATWKAKPRPKLRKATER